MTLMTDDEFRAKFTQAIDNAILGCETRNIMMIMGGLLESSRLLNAFFGDGWVTERMGRLMALRDWVQSPAGKAWFAQNVEPLFELMKDRE